MEFERVSRLRKRVRWLGVLAALSGIGVWLTAPFGIVLLVRGDASGWLLAGAGAVLAAGCVLAIVAAVRVRRLVAPQSLPGRANPGFDETAPSPDPRPGAAWSGSTLSSR